MTLKLKDYQDAFDKQKQMDKAVDWMLDKLFKRFENNLRVIMVASPSRKMNINLTDFITSVLDKNDDEENAHHYHNIMMAKMVYNGKFVEMLRNDDSVFFEYCRTLAPINNDKIVYSVANDKDDDTILSLDWSNIIKQRKEK